MRNWTRAGLSSSVSSDRGDAMSVTSTVQKALEQSKGILRLAPNWVPRSFCIPGVTENAAKHFGPGNPDLKP